MPGAERKNEFRDDLLHPSLTGAKNLLKPPAVEALRNFINLQTHFLSTYEAQCSSNTFTCLFSKKRR